MKKFALQFGLLVASLLAVASVQAQAYLQDPKWGDSPEARQSNVEAMNYFNDAYSNKDYDRAAGYLQQLMDGAPTASQNLYIKGINIYRSKIATASTDDVRQVMVDSLMLVYDKRIEAFGSHATRGTTYLLGMKARDLLAHNPEDKAGIRSLFRQALESEPTKADPELITIYFNGLVEDYGNDALSTDELLAEYDYLSGIFDLLGTSDAVAEQKSTFDNLFVSSGAASCENLEKVFGPSIEKNPEDKDLISKTFRLLLANDCNTPFQLSVGEKLYALDPTSQVALNLAAAFENENNLDKANYYLTAAMESETDPAVKANLSLRMGGTALQAGEAKKAAEFARQAIEFDPQNGYAYMILANAYVSGVNACSGFDRQASYWLIVDTLVKARELLSSDEAQLKSLNEQISSFTNAFPSNEECFFRGLESGSGYTVSCGWVSGRTSVRTVR